MPKLHSATFYVQIAPEHGHWEDINTGEKVILGAKAVGITQQRPKKPQPGSVVVKLTVDLPEAAFLPLRPEAIISIPTELTDPTPILVEAHDPHSEDDLD